MDFADDPLRFAQAVYPSRGPYSRQAFHLGVESHDDLCDDELTTLLNGFVAQGLELPKIQWIET